MDKFMNEMKSNEYMRLIGEYLLSRKIDIEKANKSLSGCMKYISNIAKLRAKNGVACLTDNYVYQLAVHYYDEEHPESFTPEEEPVDMNPVNEKVIERVVEKVVYVEKEIDNSELIQLKQELELFKNASKNKIKKKKEDIKQETTIFDFI